MLRFYDHVKDNFEDFETPEDDLENGPGEIAPEAHVAEAKGLHDLVQVLHVLPEHHHSALQQISTEHNNGKMFTVYITNYSKIFAHI